MWACVDGLSALEQAQDRFHVDSRRFQELGEALRGRLEASRLGG